MSRIPLAIAIRMYLSRRGRGFCGEVATRFDFMIRKNRKRVLSGQIHECDFGGEPYCLQSGRDVQADRQFFLEKQSIVEPAQD